SWSGRVAWLCSALVAVGGGWCCDVSVRLFFFFQAEDGIRDLIVTGVQTCALPISDKLRQILTRPPGYRCSDHWGKDSDRGQVRICLSLSAANKPLPAIERLWSVTGERSEERRVGKECRSRWSAYRYNKKIYE